MRKIVASLLLCLLFVDFAKAQDFYWATKPTLCGSTSFVLQNLEDDGYLYVGKSDLFSGNEQNKKFAGNVIFVIKDDELIIVESFFDSNQNPNQGKSCLISVSKSFTMYKNKKQNEW